MINNNKRGVSLMVSYVLLVIIALGLAILVFTYLRVYAPSGETPECSKAVELIMQDVSCSTSLEPRFTLLNRGLFTVDAVSIRIRDEGREVATVQGGDITAIFGTILTGLSEDGLPPGQSFSYPNGNLPTPPTLTSGNTYDIEIQPQEFIGSGNKIAVCSDAVIRQTFTCQTSQIPAP